MVKRVDNTRAPGSQPIESGKAIESTKVGAVGQVGAAEPQAPTGSVGRVNRPITAEEREQLYKLLGEEADKMFNEEAIAKEKREKVERAVQMVIDASLVKDETETK